VDLQGRYRRFVVQQTLLDALLERVELASDAPRQELLQEAAVVLAGTILMASGTSGSGPDAFDSSTTLSTLLPRIAKYRDEFYKETLARGTGPHADRLRAEAGPSRCDNRLLRPGSTSTPRWRAAALCNYSTSISRFSLPEWDTPTPPCARQTWFPPPRRECCAKFTV
jgi:hypothetical protein